MKRVIINEEKIRAESRERIRQRGLQSGYLKTYLDEVLKVELPWTQILKNAIKKYSIMLPCRRTWIRPNKKYFAHNHILPGITSVSQTDAVGTCVIGIDTSGSISDDDLMKFYEKVNPIYKKIILNCEENLNLEQLRDTLLPKLMNGEIDLDKIEI